MSRRTQRLRRRLQRFLTHGGEIDAQHVDYRRVLLLNLTLLVLLGLAIAFALVNLLLLDLQAIALLDAVAALTALGILLWYRATRRLEVACWVTMLLVAGFLLGYIALVQGRHYSLVWLCVYPGLALFLLGARAGLLSVLGLFVAALILMLGPWAQALDHVLDAESAFNLFGALLSLVVQSRYSELARQEVLRGLLESNRALQRLSTHDRLTGLYNRHKLDQRLGEEVARAQRHGSPFCVAMIDIDHFKRVNDSHGHAVGDLVLQCLGHLMLRGRRASDMVGRWGGEEFLILCPETHLDGGVLVAERLRVAAQDCPMPEAGRVTLSAGVAEFRRGDSVESLLARADAALYRAKAAGRNRVEANAPAVEIDPHGVQESSP